LLGRESLLEAVHKLYGTPADENGFAVEAEDSDCGAHDPVTLMKKMVQRARPERLGSKQKRAGALKRKFQKGLQPETVFSQEAPALWQRRPCSGCP
jgi:hypothetical protein